MNATETATLTAPDFYEQLGEWEGAPPAYLSTWPLGHVTSAVMDFLEASPVVATGSDFDVWVSIDLTELQRIATRDAAAFREVTGMQPW